MKSFIIILLLFTSTIICGQTKSKIIRKTIIDIATVDYVKIGKYLKKPKVIVDSSWSVEYKNLNNEQIKYIVDQWNVSELIGEKSLNQNTHLISILKMVVKRLLK